MGELDKIEVTCSKCGNVLKFSSKFIGRTGMCPSCGTTFNIVKPEGTAPGLPRLPGNVSGKTHFKISSYFGKAKPKPK